MKKSKLLNAPLSAVVAELGHTDKVVICDCGLPIPQEVERIDLAVARGLPGFFPVFDAMTSELSIEKVILAEEVKTVSPAFLEEFTKRVEALARKQRAPISVEFIPHTNFKQMTATTRAIVRTGECTSYANVIFVAGVAFEEPAEI